ncbi:hypothetical protein F511_22105 [Dorcoceras hygrometricum]|uniref:Dystroglycan-like n=1 Tax=Dorcoceras hygrometricum TaxID=472368 RepID=A0A2Z7BVQ0_9LAMI|nr:hypothetical protein F511_22105 [Dorcoceras hygrometricum]
MDHEGMVAMFEALVATSLKDFLGCPGVVYEDELIEFFQNGSVRDGMVASTVNGKTVEILEELFAETFQLPVEGLTDMNDVPKDVVFDARSVFSYDGTQIETSGKKRKMKFEFRLLNDILEKSVTVKAGSFDDVTLERFLMMAAINGGIPINWSKVLFNIFKDMVIAGSRQAKCFAIQISLLLEDVPNLELGDSSEFPSSRILTDNIFKDMVIAGSRQAKCFAIQISLLLEDVPNLELGDSSEFPSSRILTERTVHRYIVINDKVGIEEVADITRVKKTPKKKAVPRKRPAVVTDVEPVTVAPTMEDEPVVESTSEELRTTSADDVDIIIDQVIAETAQLEMDEGEPDVSKTDVGAQETHRADETDQWFNLSYEELYSTDIPVETASDTDEDIEIVYFGTAVGDQKLQTLAENERSADASAVYIATEPVDIVEMAADEHSVRVDEGNWYKASLPKIPATDKGKAPLQIKDPIKGKPWKEIFSLILADTEILVQLRAEVTDEVDRFFNSFSFKKLPHLKIEEISAKEALILSWAETDSTRVALQRRKFIMTKYRELLIRKFLEARKINFFPGDGTSATELKVLKWLSDLHMFLLEELKEQTLAHGLSWEKRRCSKLFEGRPRDRGAVIARLNTNFRSSCWIRTMIKVDGSWVIESCTDFWKPLARPVVCTEVPRQLSYVDTLPPVSDFFKVMKKQWADVCMEVAKFFVSEKLLPVGSINLCRALSVVESVPAFEFGRPNVTSWGWSQLDDIHLEDDSVPDQFIQPSSATAICASLAALRESFSNLVANQSRDFRKTSDAHSEVMCKINHVERVFLDSLAEQNETFRGLFKRNRQEAQNDNNALSLALKAVRTQNAILSTDLEAMQKEVKDLQMLNRPGSYRVEISQLMSRPSDVELNIFRR